MRKNRALLLLSMLAVLVSGPNAGQAAEESRIHQLEKQLEMMQKAMSGMQAELKGLHTAQEEEKKEQLFSDGLRAYEEKDFFEAHELWEKLWSEYYLADRTLIQGLIQLAVSFVHLGNGSLNGAKSLLN